jgi:hypothetical protein
VLTWNGDDPGPRRPRSPTAGSWPTQRCAGLDLSDHRRRIRPWETGGGSLTGPNPVDLGKKGSKLHVLSEAQGIPLTVGMSGANVHDSQAFKLLLLGLPAMRSRRGPRRLRPVKVRADMAYYSAEHLAWLRSRGLVPRIARPGIESGKGQPLPRLLSTATQISPEAASESPHWRPAVTPQPRPDISPLLVGGSAQREHPLTAGGLVQPEGITLGDHDVSMVQEPVDGRGGQGHGHGHGHDLVEA